MVATLDRLILDQVVYEDLSKVVYKDFDSENEHWIKIIDKTFDAFNKSENGGKTISRNDIIQTLEKFKLVYAQDESNDKAKGFYAGAFEKVSAGEAEIVIAIRGSLPLEEKNEDPAEFVDDWIETNLGELPLAFNEVDKFTRLDMAHKFYRDLKEEVVFLEFYKLSISGHSMGGALAQRLAVDLIDEGKEVICETFNAPGMLHSLSDEMQARAKTGKYDSIVNYVNKEDSLVGMMDLTINETVMDGVGMALRLFFSKKIALSALIGAQLYLEMEHKLEGQPIIDLVKIVVKHSINKNYQTEFFKHIGKTYYVNGEDAGFEKVTETFIYEGKECTVELNKPKSDTHSLFNFLKDVNFTTGNFSAESGMDIILNDGFDNIIGTEHNDIVLLKGGDDIIHAGDGSDRIYGGSGNDIIDGGKGNDDLFGGSGDDTYLINTNEGSDTIVENDVVESKDRNTLILDGINHQELYFRYEEVKDENGLTHENVVINFIDSESSITLVDYLARYHVSNNLVDGNPSQLLMGTSGTTLNHIMVGGRDLLEGESGILVKDGVNKRDMDYNAVRDDSSFGPKIILGLDGDDTIFGWNDNDAIYGGDDNDTLHGLQGHDYISGGFGEDTINGGWGNDIIYGDIKVEGYDERSTGLNDDTINGGSGDDIIRGGFGGDTIDGGSGDDYIEGNEGDDTIHGGLGNDTIVFDSGSDVLEGGSGSDLYIMKEDYQNFAQENIIIENEYYKGGFDRVKLLFSSLHARVKKDGNDLLIKSYATGEYEGAIRLKDVLLNDGKLFDEIEVIEFSDGKYIHLKDLLSKEYAVSEAKRKNLGTTNLEVGIFKERDVEVDIIDSKNDYNTINRNNDNIIIVEDSVDSVLKNHTPINGGSGSDVYQLC